MKAVILAGGKGTRLRAVCSTIPKPLVPIGNRPLLEHQIALLARYGIRDVLLLVGHLAEQIEAHFGDGQRFGVRIVYHTETEPLGTTGGLKANERQLTEDFVVLYGDVMLDLSLGRLIEFHRARAATATLVVHPNDHPQDSDLLELDGERRVIAFYPKRRPDHTYYPNLVNAGAYVMSPRIFAHLARGVPEDFGSDVFPRLVGVEPLYGYRTAEYLKDVGTPERLAQVERDHASGKIGRLNADGKRRAIFLDRDGVINRHVGLLHRAEDLELLPGVSTALGSVNRSDYLALVVTNQSVVARNLCSIEELAGIHRKLETLLGRDGAWVDAIYACPHHPDRGYLEENPSYKVDCACRKPKTGLITQAAQEFNIDLPASFFIGDSERDVLCARAAGTTAFAVRTGEGYRQARAVPDAVFEDLAEAVRFCLEDPYRETFEQVRRALAAAHPARPFVISIGGNSRSGKSILGNYLAREFARLGVSTLVIELDHWLRPAHERAACRNVLDRFRIDVLERDVGSILEHGAEIVLERYAPYFRGPTGDTLRYKLGAEEVVILEGIVALATPRLRDLSRLRIFLDIDEATLVERIRRFYAWKGSTSEEIESLIAARLADEYRLIAADRRHAQLVVVSGSR